MQDVKTTTLLSKVSFHKYISSQSFSHDSASTGVDFFLRSRFGEVFSCCSQTVLPGPAWVLLKCALRRIKETSVHSHHDFEHYRPEDQPFRLIGGLLFKLTKIPILNCCSQREWRNVLRQRADADLLERLAAAQGARGEKEAREPLRRPRDASTSRTGIHGIHIYACFTTIKLKKLSD